MKNSAHIFRRLISYIVWGIVILIVLFLVLIAISSYIPKHWPSESTAELERIRKELPLAEARWKAHKISEYEIDALGLVHPGGCFDVTKDPFSDSLTPWSLKVSQGEIIFDSEIQKKNIKDCGADFLLPPKVFDTIRKRLEKTDPKERYLKIEFDPEYGFVSDYFLTSNSNRSDLYIQFTFSNFRPKEP